MCSTQSFGRLNLWNLLSMSIHWLRSITPHNMGWSGGVGVVRGSSCLGGGVVVRIGVPLVFLVVLHFVVLVVWLQFALLKWKFKWFILPCVWSAVQLLRWILLRINGSLSVWLIAELLSSVGDKTISNLRQVCTESTTSSAFCVKWWRHWIFGWICTPVRFMLYRVLLLSTTKISDLYLAGGVVKSTIWIHQLLVF